MPVQHSKEEENPEIKEKAARVSLLYIYIYIYIFKVFYFCGLNFYKQTVETTNKEQISEHKNRSTNLL